MRRLLVLITLLVLLAAPYASLSHNHRLGQGHGDCPACHLESNPAQEVSVTFDTFERVSFGEVPCVTRITLLAVTKPLLLAPKTSPPQLRS